MTRRLLAVALLAGGLAVLTPTPAATAAARISVTNDRGTTAADLEYRTKLTITGRGFQSVKGGFGGVYLMFGWVDDPRGGSWKPSRGGVTGSDYRYIPDAENAADSQGYLRFIAFPGSSTATEANAVLSASGGFTVTLNIPGPTFQSVDRNGRVVSVDCRKVTCGVITIGAHGVKNAANETFTRVPFTTVYDAAPAGQDTTTTDGTTTAGNGAATGTGTTTGTTTTGATGAIGTGRKARAGTPRLTTDRLTAKVGNTLAFTATGFAPGEQVVGVLDDGVAGIGPMVAGPSGEVAGILPLPATLSAGTHELRLTGAASGGAASERFAVRAVDVSPAPEAAPEDDERPGSRVFLFVAAGLFALTLLGLVLRLARRRRRAAGSTGALA
ncbi:MULTISPECIES: hypothetical protein [unclassified Nocardioides]|uniref:hypothetical protein n=1 Tax=unclassified Nocardioides TaxID=2615069 RepID=UPI0007034ADD|nr:MULTISPECIES: hypothetical protein [unclassified Nocardioides]KRC54975.1 hypothetical protein ASE19_05900 [Nocardioides sp. Root79]KRC73675.1 hypothetical protein ASE20_03315 [Nocardioides sp. Root240]